MQSAIQPRLQITKVTFFDPRNKEVIDWCPQKTKTKKKKTHAVSRCLLFTRGPRNGRIPWFRRYSRAAIWWIDVYFEYDKFFPINWCVLANIRTGNWLLSGRNVLTYCGNAYMKANGSKVATHEYLLHSWSFRLCEGSPLLRSRGPENFTPWRDSVRKENPIGSGGGRAWRSGT